MTHVYVYHLFSVRTLIQYLALMQKKFASWGLGGMHLCMLTALESCTESANGGASRKWWLGSGSRIEGNYLIVYFFFPF